MKAQPKVLFGSPRRHRRNGSPLANGGWHRHASQYDGLHGSSKSAGLLYDERMRWHHPPIDGYGAASQNEAH